MQRAHGQRLSLGGDDGVYTQVAVAERELPSTCALRDDGTIACWQAVLSAPPGHFLALEMRSNAICALRDDHRLLCSGDNDGLITTPP